MGLPRWASARRELLDFMMQGKINRGRHTDHPAGRHSIRTNQCPPPPSPHFLQARCNSCRPTNSVKALKAELHILSKCGCELMQFKMFSYWKYNNPDNHASTSSLICISHQSHTHMVLYHDGHIQGMATSGSALVYLTSSAIQTTAIHQWFAYSPANATATLSPLTSLRSKSV